MPDLPTLTVSQAHYDRIVAAFVGDTLAEKAASYRAWLTNHLINEVERVETRRVEAEVSVERDAKMAAVRASLPPRQTYPPVGPPLP